MTWIDTMEGDSLKVKATGGHVIRFVDNLPGGDILKFEAVTFYPTGTWDLRINGETQSVSDGQNSVDLPAEDSTGDGMVDDVEVEFTFSDPDNTEIGDLNVYKYVPDTLAFYVARFDENFVEGCNLTEDPGPSHLVGSDCYDESWDVEVEYVYWYEEEYRSYAELNHIDEQLEFYLWSSETYGSQATARLDRTGLSIENYTHAKLFVPELTYQLGDYENPIFRIKFWGSSDTYELNYQYDSLGYGDAPIRAGHPITIDIPDIGTMEEVEIWLETYDYGISIKGKIDYLKVVDRREGCLFPLQENFTKNIFSHNWRADLGSPTEITLDKENLIISGGAGYGEIYCDNLELTDTHAALKIKGVDAETYDDVVDFYAKITGATSSDTVYFYFAARSDKVYADNEYYLGVGDHIILLDDYADHLNGAITELRVYAYNGFEGEES